MAPKIRIETTSNVVATGRRMKISAKFMGLLVSGPALTSARLRRARRSVLALAPFTPGRRSAAIAAAGRHVRAGREPQLSLRDDFLARRQPLRDHDLLTLLALDLDL